MKDRPQMELVGHDGNIYAIMGTASRLLKRNGMREEADEMFKRVTSSGSYEQALGIVSEYVQTEISFDDPGILEADDISVDTEFTFAPDGVTAYIETGFDVERRFDIRLHGDDYADLYATLHPDTGELKVTASIVRADDTREYKDIILLPCEKKLIISEMESIAKEQSDMSLTELFAEYESEHGDKQKKSPVKECKNHRNER